MSEDKRKEFFLKFSEDVQNLLEKALIDNSELGKEADIYVDEIAWITGNAMASMIYNLTNEDDSNIVEVEKLLMSSFEDIMKGYFHKIEWFKEQENVKKLH